MVGCGPLWVRRLWRRGWAALALGALAVAPAAAGAGTWSLSFPATACTGVSVDGFLAATLADASASGPVACTTSADCVDAPRQLCLSGFCQCTGDCDLDGVVTSSEIETAVDILSGAEPLASCPAADSNGDSNVLGNEISIATTNLGNGCPSNAPGPNIPLKEAYSFLHDSAGRRLHCDVMFPRSVITNTITVNLTWQPAITPAAGTRVCWQAVWEITRPGQAWGFNTASNVALSTATQTSAGDIANADIHTAFNITPADQAGTACPAGTAAGTCAASHGILAITRAPSVDCVGPMQGAALLTRIELTGETQ